MTVDETADYFRVSPPTVWRMLREGLLPRVRLGARTVIRRADADALLARLAEQPPAPQAKPNTSAASFFG